MTLTRRLRKVTTAELGLALGGLFLALLIGEGLVRWTMPHVGWRSHRDPTLGWSSGEYQSLQPGVPQPDVERILFLGDSFLAGGGVRHKGERFPEVLASRRPHTEVRILATGGWGPDQQYLAWRQKGKSWKPDTVVLAFCPTNDLANVLSNGQGFGTQKPYFTHDSSGALTLVDTQGQPRPHDLPPIKAPRNPRSYLVALARHVWRPQGRQATNSVQVAPTTGSASDPRYETFAAYQSNPERQRAQLAEVASLKAQLSWSPQDGVNHVSGFIAEPHPLPEYGWSLLSDILSALRDDVEQTGARFAVVLLPVPIQAGDLRLVTGGPLEHRFQTPTGSFTFRAAEPRDRLLALCHERGIECLDPTSEFLALASTPEAAERIWPDPNDIHFSATGHALLAQQLDTYLTSSSPRSQGQP